MTTLNLKSREKISEKGDEFKMSMYFVQHGVAVAKEVEPDRSLSKEGRREIEHISAYLKKMGITPKKIYHSGKRRAMETAQIFSDQIGDGSIHKLLGMNPSDSVKVFATFLESNDTMYIGHLPHMEKLISYLTTGNEDSGVVKFENGGVVCIENDGENFYIDWYLKPAICNL